ncbi:lectin-like [Macadamia integrifolia]|uniref:lectin-like n=1 Tax=Macadamia integrifolia TaxID=60698 RepID=UPI001C52FF34|nr:lectin-like [Macadamia integrifolia]
MPPFHGNGCEIAVEGLNPNLPHNCRAIMKRSESAGCGISTEKLYEHLYSGVFLDHKRKKYWIDPKTGYNCFMLFARDLSITWGDDNRYWKWDSLQETSDVRVDIAELKNVCWLEVRGKFDTSNLSPGVMYEVAFVVMLKEASNGWNAPLNLELALPDGKKQEHKENLQYKPKGQWMELVIGEFWTCQNMDGDIQFSLLEIKGGQWKNGFIIKGVIIRPKNCYDKPPHHHGHFTMISRDLSITWGDNQQYWHWYCLNETGNNLVDVAELLNVCWLEAKGNFNISKLSPGIVYEVSFIVMLKDPAYGWEVPVNLRLVLPDGKMHERKECLQHKPKGQWMELKVGEFKKCPGNNGEIQFSLFEIEGGQWKKGLVIKSVVIRPKN